MILTTVALLGLLLQNKDTVVYKNQKLGLLFEYPKTWKVRRERYAAAFEIPLNGGQVASVQLFNAKYKGVAEDWQAIQLQINTAMKRNVDRQWEEDYLGVPMLMTKITYLEAGQRKTGIIGLLYTAYEEKMNFRLTAPQAGAEQAENAWRDAMLTLRTVSGELPAVEDPNRPSVKPEPLKPTSVWKPVEGTKKTVRGKVSASLVQEGSRYKLCLPNGWTVNDHQLVHPRLSGKLQVSTAIGLAEDAGQHLLQSANKSLAEFTVVSMREDPSTLPADSGAVVGRVFRIGKGATGQLVAGTAVGYCEGVYWMLDYRNDDPKSYDRDRSLLDELYRLLYAEKE